MKKSRRRKKSGSGPKHFSPPTIPEMIILTVLFLLLATAASVFTADGIVFTKILMLSQRAAPDKNDVVARIEHYKAGSGKYPPELFRVGLKNYYGTVYLSYMADENFFQLCYHHFPYLGTMADCYDSASKVWATQ